jgi:hypothetical protein
MKQCLQNMAFRKGLASRFHNSRTKKVIVFIRKIPNTSRRAKATTRKGCIEFLEAWSPGALDLLNINNN